MTNNMLSVEDVAAEFRVQPRTVYNYIKYGGLNAHKVGKRWLIAREDLEEFIIMGTPVDYSDRIRGID